MSDEEEEHYAHWPTKAQAAERLQCAERTIERMAALGQIEQRLRKSPGRKPEPIYNPDDIAARKPAAFVMPPPAAVSVVQRPPQLPAPPDPLGQLAKLLGAIHVPTPEPAPPCPPLPLWLDLAQAATVSGLSTGTLRHLIKTGALRALRDQRRWKIHRDTLENFDNRDSTPPLSKLSK